MHPPRPTPRQCVQLSAMTGKGVQTIGRLYDGHDVLMSTYVAVAAAARELGVPEPPPPIAASADGATDE